MIATRHLQVRLGDRPVLHDLSVTFDRGWTAIVGPNGAGKSTLLRAMAGLVRPAAGEVLLQGRPLPAWTARERARAVAWLAQHAEAGGDLTVRDVVTLGRVPHLGLLGAVGPADLAAVEAAMAAAGCAAWPDRPLAALSGGERQRVLWARALAVESPVLLLDEPTTHLDPPHQVALVRLLRDLRRERTVVCVLHDINLGLRADRVVVMREGTVVADAPSADPAMHRALERVFDGALEVRPAGGHWVALPRTD